MARFKTNGLIAATYTPMHRDGRLHLRQVAPMVEHLIRNGIKGLYVCGSTGEGMSLTTEERKQVAEAFIAANAGRVPVIVQVGHNSLADACSLAAHSEAAGADAVSATCPSYFQAADVPTLVDSIADVAAAAAKTPFYYYHIPALTGSTLDIVEFLELGHGRIPTLTGLKYTDTKLHEYQRCQTVANGELDVVFGCDEMLLGALAHGATAAIGSTYNVIAPVYQRLIDAFRGHDLKTARTEQMRSIEFVRTLNQFPFHSAMKELFALIGLDIGTCRLPQRPLRAEEVTFLRHELDSRGFLSTITSDSPPPMS